MPADSTSAPCDVRPPIPAATGLPDARPAERARTWRQRWQQPRVRIGSVLVLIVLISAMLFVAPRRGLIVVKLAGARVELIHPLEHRPLARSILFGFSPQFREFLGRNNQRLNWLGTDDDVGLVGLNSVSNLQRLIPWLTRFPRAKSLIVQGSIPADAFSAAGELRFERLVISGNGGPVAVNGIHTLGALRELKLVNVSALKAVSGDSLSVLNRLDRLDVFASPLAPTAFVQFSQMDRFSGTLAFNRCQGIDAAGLQRLAGLRRLARLELNFCPGIGDKEIAALHQFRQLRFLQLRLLVTQETISARRQLRQALPECRFE